MAKTVTIDQLSAEDRAALLKQLEQEQKEAAEKVRKDKENYKQLQDDVLGRIVPKLLAFNDEQQAIVKHVYGECEALIEMKKELYDTKSVQDSHTFTAQDGSASVRIGYNTIIGFDGTQSAGIEKVKAYLSSLGGDDEKRQTLSGLLNTFLKEDKDGRLNPQRVKELSDWKDKIHDESFREGITIIEDAQVKVRTTTYVRGWAFLGEDGEERRKVNFNISIEGVS